MRGALMLMRGVAAPPRSTMKSHCTSVGGNGVQPPKLSSAPRPDTLMLSQFVLQVPAATVAVGGMPENTSTARHSALLAGVLKVDAFGKKRCPQLTCEVAL